MKNKALLIFTSLLLIFSAGLFYFSTNLNKNIENIKNENKDLAKKVEEKTFDRDHLQGEALISREDLENLKNEFKIKYGYEFDKGEKELVNEEVKNLENKNLKVTENIKNIIIKYKDFYIGNYFKDENLDLIIGNFLNMSNIETEQITKDLYEVSDINKFMNQNINEGTLGYLVKLNGDTKTLKLMYFAAIIVSRDFNDVVSTSDINNNYNALYERAIALRTIFKAMEDMGIKTGNLSSKNLNQFAYELKVQFDDFFMRKGVIETLKAGVEDEK